MHTSLYNCPHCNAPMDLELREGYFYNCENCNKAAVQKQNEKTLIATSFSNEYDILSPILLKSKGSYKSESFKITGTILLHKANGIVAIHTALLQNGLYRYLIEEDGSFSFITEVTDKITSQMQKSSVGNMVSISEQEQVFCNSIENIDDILLIGTGKLPAPNLSNSVWCSFLTPGAKAHYLIAHKLSSVFLSGNTVSLKELQLTPIRNFDDWCS